MNAWIDSNLNPQLAAACLDALLKSFVVLAFAGGLCLAWRRAAATTRHLIWFFGLVGLLSLPLLPFVLPTTHRPLWSVSGGLSSGNQVALSLELTPGQSEVSPGESVSAQQASAQPTHENARQLLNARVNRDWLSIGFGVWALGVFLTLLYPLIGQIQLRKIGKNADTLAAPDWVNLLAEASAMLGLRGRVMLLQSRENVMPLTWGWLRPKVLMPAEAEQWPTERRRVVLLHELAHVKRRDCLTQNIARVVCALYWFNPLAWVAARQMRVERERACDDLVLNGGCKASDYAGHLVQIATAFRHTPQTAGIAMARSSNLEERVTAIVDSSRVRQMRPAGLVGILISLGALIFYIGGYTTNAANTDKSSAANKETLALIEKFSAEKEAQSKLLAAAAGETIAPEFQKYFEAAKQGDFRTVTNMYADFKQHHPQYSHGEHGKDVRFAYRTSYWQPMLEIALIYDHFAMSDAKYASAAADDIINSIPAGSIYFGGTDPGRALPTAFSKSQVNANPFYTLSQNPLADPTYEEYLRDMYGEKRLTLVQLAAARQADPELSALDKEYQEVHEKALSLEMSKPETDPERQAAEKTFEDFISKRDKAWARVEKSVTADEHSAAANSWSEYRVIYTPSNQDMQKTFQNYMLDLQKRKQENKLKPGENIETTVDERGGQHTQVSGQTAVQTIDAGLSKIIFDQNPGREFYVEESFPHDWMYPHLEPNGLIMKINREPLAELPDDVVQKDQDYWQTRVDGWLGNWLTPETTVEEVADFATKVYGRKNLTGFTGDAGFIQDDYAPKMYSEWRSSIAGIYAWRLGYGTVELPAEYAPKSDAEKQKLRQAADFAFKQAFALCPSSPEAVFGYVNFLVKEGRKADALAVAHAAVMIDPINEPFHQLELSIPAQIKSSATELQSNQLAIKAAQLREAQMHNVERLQQMQALKVQLEPKFEQQKALLEKLKSMNHADLRKALPVAEHDDELNRLLTDYAQAQQNRIRLQINYTTNHPAMLSAQATIDDLDKKIDQRMEGIMLGLEAKLAYSAAYLDTLNKDMEVLQKASQSAQ